MPGSGSAEQLTEDVAAMNERLLHRGPDDGGTWVDAASGVALGHRRLSIVDLSPAGHQPMVSGSGRFVMVFNGEIYNYRELRKQLEQTGAAIAWKGHSDSEVLLAAIVAWGIDKALTACVGMFALAVWDREEKKIYLARDRMGEKPLYYGYQQGVLVFASELKALKAYPQWRGDIDRDALTLLLRFNYIPAPYSIYQGINKLPPGTLLTLSAGQKQLPEPLPYWSLKTVAEAGQQQLFSGNDADAVNALDKVLQQSVAGQMVADVPLGAFLSGGFDSSLVVALMQEQSISPVKTFSIGFHERDFNEAQHAKAVAGHLGTDHTELYVSPRQVMDIIPELPTIYDEPFSDVSQMPTFLVAQLAKQHVTVSLSGDGGDELFGGYSRYFQAAGLWRRLANLPQPLRSVAARLLTAVPISSWNQLCSLVGPVHEVLQAGRAGDRLHKFAPIIAASGHKDMYRLFMSHWHDPENVVLAGEELPTVLDQQQLFAGLFEQMMYVDSLSYLPDDILIKVDRAAMAVSLETRVPLLDHRVVEFAWRLPLAMKVREGQGKWLLKQVLYRYVPQALVDRPKMGFAVPIDHWLRGPLRDWAEELLGEQRLTAQGYFNAKPIRQKWREHLSGKRNWHYYLWDILMFQAWIEQQ